MKVVDVAIEDLTMHPENANNGDVEAISESIEVNGFFAPLLVQRSSGFILVGNHRFVAALTLGTTSMPVIYLDVDDNHAKRIMLADNRTARLGMDDEAQLVELLDELYATDIGLGGTGYDYRDLERLHAVVDEPLVFEHDDSLGLPGLPAVQERDTPRLYFSVLPQKDADGTVHELIVSRPDFKHISLREMHAIRKALGLDRMSQEEIDVYEVDDWKAGG